MGNLELGFDRPEFLWLLLLLPVFWAISLRTLASLGPVRWWTALALRTLVAVLFVCAMAEMQLHRFSDRITVIYLLDQSDSIPGPQRELMRQYVVEHVRARTVMRGGETAGVIVFARDAAIEIPPFDDDLPDTGTLETLLQRRDATHVEAALKLAQASFPEDTAKRIVIISDGNENLGDALSVAPLLASNGIGIDVVPVKRSARAEIAVEKVALASDIRQGAPFELRVVLHNFMEPSTDRASDAVSGKLRVLSSAGGHEELLGEEHVELPPGKTVVSFSHRVDRPAVYTYRAVLLPDRLEDDSMPQNNEASAFIHVRGKGRVLLIEDCDHRGEFAFLVERMRRMDVETDVRPSNQLFTSLGELQGYDCIVLANVPRSSGDDALGVSAFRDDQVSMLVRNTQQLGGGLIMLGGPHAFGAGGWANTELEAAMPVDFQIRNAEVHAVGALVLIMHASEMAEGNHWQKVVAREALQALGPADYCGLIHWNNMGRDSWLWGGPRGLVPIERRRAAMLAALERMAPGDMPDFEPSLKMALDAFRRVPAAMKHMIIMSDGDPSPPFASTIDLLRQAEIKITTVAVGTHGPAGSAPLQSLARATGGQYYEVTHPRILPRIFQREARRVARPLVKDLDDAVPRIVYPHEILEGIEGSLPPLKGMVLTTVKDNPLVEVAIRSPIPEDARNATILAAWTYGLGRAAVLTTDAGQRWASAWTRWEYYDKFFSQLIRWSMRPASDRGNHTVATDVRDGKVRVVVTAWDHSDEFRTSRDMSASAVGPDLQPLEFAMRQIASGRYVGEFAADRAGSYHVTVVPHPGAGPIFSGVHVPHSAEFRDRDTNLGLLESLVALRPEGGHPGKLAGAALSAANLGPLLQLDAFRSDLPKALSVQDIWPWLVVSAAVLFWGDVFVRRVAVTADWLRSAARWVVRHGAKTSAKLPAEARLERLRDTKAQLARSIDQRRAAARFEPRADEGMASSRGVDLEGVPQKALPITPPSPQAQTEKPPAPADVSEADSYMARLLEAKRQAAKEHDRTRES